MIFKDGIRPEVWLRPICTRWTVKYTNVIIIYAFQGETSHERKESRTQGIRHNILLVLSKYNPTEYTQRDKAKMKEHEGECLGIYNILDGTKTDH